MVTRTRIGFGSATGFTLLELLVVLTIAGLLMTLVPPVISAVVPGARLSTAARELAVTLRDAHNRAIRQSTVVDVAFDFEPPQYTVAGGAARKLPDGVEISILDHAAKTWQQSLPATVVTAGEPYRLRFYPDGSSSGAIIRLAGPERHHLLEVGWLMSRVSIRDGRSGAQ